MESILCGPCYPHPIAMTLQLAGPWLIGAPPSLCKPPSNNYQLPTWRVECRSEWLLANG